MSAQAERQRRYRRRRQRGQTVYHITADDRFLLALIEAGRLTPEETADASRVADEATDVIAQWARRWRP